MIMQQEPLGEGFEAPARGWRKAMDFLLPALLGLLVFTLTLGPGILKPHNVQWLNKGDAAQHLIGLRYFFQEPWLLPPGKMTYYGDGVATSVVYTDSVPLIAIPAKWMVRTFGMTEIVQPFGLFIAACFALQGLCAFLLLRDLTKDRWLSLLGATLMLLSPPLFMRIPMHLSLGAQWLILWALWLFIQPAELTWRKNFVWFALLVIALGIHCYFFVMCAAIYGVKLLLGKWNRQLSWARIARYLAALGLLVAAAGWFFGYFLAVNPRGGGYGICKFNLLSFFNPMDGWSRLVPNFPLSIGDEYEGFAWFGIGLILLSVAASVIAPRSAERESALSAWKSPFLIAMLVGFLAAAMTPYLNLGTLGKTSSLMCVAGGLVLLCAWAVRGKPFQSRLVWQRLLAFPLMGLLSVMTGAALVAALILPWEPAFLCDILRASGRMAWPVFYWFACWSIALVAVRFTRPLACGVLGLCIALQAFDLAPKLNQKHRDDLGPGELTKLSCALPSQKMTDALWDLGNSKKHLWIITRDYVPKEADRLGLLAIQKGMKINCPYVARSYGKITKQRNKEMTDLLDAGNIPEDVVYYVYPNARMHATLAVERAAAQVEFIEEGGFTLLTRAKQPSEELAQSNRLRWSLATPSLAIAPGQPISFAAGGEASACPGALSGFSDFLADGVSTYLPDASIILKVPASPTDLRLMTTVQAALNPKTNPGQSVKIYANDAPVGKWSFTSSEPMQREIVIPRRLIPKNSLVFLRFEIAQAVSPKTLGINADPRELGVHFVRMESAPRD